MKIITKELTLETSGAGDLLNITDDLRILLSGSRLKEGAITVFAVGSTFGITCFEYEPGLIKDMKDLYEKLVPSDRPYSHDDTSGATPTASATCARRCRGPRSPCRLKAANC